MLRELGPLLAEEGIDVNDIDVPAMDTLQNALNNRPRKVLNWRTPAEVFEEQLRSLQQPGVASTS